MAMPHDLQDLSASTRDWVPVALEVPHPNLWTARELPRVISENFNLSLSAANITLAISEVLNLPLLLKNLFLELPLGSHLKNLLKFFF